MLEELEIRAVMTLDQSFDPWVDGNASMSTSVAYFNTNQEAAQTFTVGISGILTRVDVYIDRFSGDTGPLILDIRGTQPDGRPTSGAGLQLLTTSVPASAVPEAIGFFAFDVSAFNVYVNEGEKLAVALHVGEEVGANVTYWWGGSTQNFYSRGGYTDRVIGNYDWFAPHAEWDVGFRTWVEPGAPQAPNVNLPGGPITHNEDDPPTLFAAGATVTDADSPNLENGVLTVSLTANAAPDDRLAIRHEGNGAGQIGVSGNTVLFGGLTMGTISGGAGATPLVVNLNNRATPAATQALVRNLTYRTVSHTPTLEPRTIQLVLSDGDGATGDADAVTVNVNATNDVPVVTTNLGLTVTEGGTSTITAARLTTSDPDNSAAQLIYTVASGPTHGTLLLNGSAATTFTQADINAGLLAYQHGGGEPAAENFTFTVSDGTATTTLRTFNITITPQNDPPAITTNTGASVAQNSTTTITQALLKATDVDTAPAQLTFAVTIAPTYGSVRLNGNPTSTFTQAQINAGFVTYRHNGGTAPADSFTVTVTDGVSTTAPAVFNITVFSIEPPVVTTNGGLAVIRDYSVVITPAQLETTDPDTYPAQLTYTVATGPAHGVLRLNGVPAATFTQADINAGLVVYRNFGGPAPGDNFTFSVSDGNQSTPLTNAALAVLVNPNSVIIVSDFDATAGAVKFTGDGGGNVNDPLELFAVDIGGGQFALGHTAYDPDLEGQTDLDQNVPGIQQLILGSGMSPMIAVNLQTGNDSVSVDNSTGQFSTPMTFDGGSGRDLLRLLGTQAHSWSIAAPFAGTVDGAAMAFTATEDLTGAAGDDTFAFAPGATAGTLDGGPGADTLDYSALSTPVEVFLSAGAASHTTGVAGMDTVLGGSADDILVAGPDGSVLVGGAGADTLLGNAGADQLTGAAGNDLIVGGAGFDEMRESLPTELFITLTNSSLFGGLDTGHDLLDGVESANLTAGPGRNLMRATAFTLGPVTLDGGAGDDRLFGSPQDDFLRGGDGRDRLIGGRGNDTFTGGRGNDVLIGGPGNDLVRETDILGSDVTLTSGRLKTAANVLGTDVLVSIGRAFLSLAAAETEGRTLSAGGFRTGPVTLLGGGGADVLIGTVKSGDLLVGGAGADTLNSGKGADTVDGGLDLDTHVTLKGAGLDDVVIDVP